MTRQELKQRVVSNPAVVQAHVRFVGGAPVQPEASMLEALADGWIDTVIEEMLAHEGIRRGASQDSYSLTLVSGTSTYTLPENIGKVLAIVLGSNNLPLNNFVTITDYLSWKYETSGETSTNDVPTFGFYFPNRDPSTEALNVTFVGAVTSSGTATVWFLSKSDPPYSMSIFPSNLHHVVLQGVMAKMTGHQAMAQMYEKLKDNAARMLIPKIGGYSRAKLDPRWRMRNWQRSNASDSSFSYPPHRTN